MDPDQLFTRLERQVITLAATSQGECEGLLHDGPRQGWLASILRGLVPVAVAKPLANERLEALRKLACACFGSAGRPDRQAVDTALAAGINSEQVAGLNGLAARHFPGR